MANIIIGENHNIFEYAYINDALLLEENQDYSSFEQQQKVKYYIQSIQEVNQKLKKFGKYLLVYSTPSKAMFCKQDIPKKFLREEKVGKRAIDVFNENIKNTSINYINSGELLKQNHYNIGLPIYYNTGIHWSRTAEQFISYTIIKKLKEITGKSLKTIELGKVNEQSSPYWRDDDVYNLLNIYSKSNENRYYEYSTSTNIPFQCDEISLLMQGDSFLGGLDKDCKDNAIALNYFRIFYKDFYEDTNGVRKQLKQWDDLPLQEMLDNSNVVVIEFNEAILQNFSNGFLNHLNKFLDGYKPEKKNIKAITKFDVNNNDAFSQASMGIYSKEQSYSWTDKYMRVRLNNNEINQNGLLIDFTIPNELMKYSNANVNVKIYLDGVLKESIVTKNAMHKIIKLTTDKIDTNKDIHLLELYSSSYFIPNRVGLNADSRRLALQLHYIGEVK